MNATRRGGGRGGKKNTAQEETGTAEQGALAQAALERGARERVSAAPSRFDLSYSKRHALRDADLPGAPPLRPKGASSSNWSEDRRLQAPKRVAVENVPLTYAERRRVFEQTAKRAALLGRGVGRGRLLPVYRQVEDVPELY